MLNAISQAAKESMHPSHFLLRVNFQLGVPLKAVNPLIPVPSADGHHLQPYHILGFSLVVAHLTALTKWTTQPRPLQLPPEDMQAFYCLIKPFSFSSAPIFFYPDPAAPFIVQMVQTGNSIRAPFSTGKMGSVL